MAEGGTVVGNMDDLVVDASRCLRMRFSESGCRRCIDICPHGAVSLDSGLSINPQLCRGCLLCTTVCPVGALEQSRDFSTCLEQLTKVAGPVLGCLRSKGCANATLACLGGLSDEFLVAICHTLTGTLTLNLSLCSDCANKGMIPHLRQRLAAFPRSGLSDGGCLVVPVEAVDDVRYRDESLDRRSFFKSFRSALFQSAAAIMSTSGEHSSKQTPYGEKRLPEKRVLLNRIRKDLSSEIALRICARFDSQADFNDTCTACQSCVSICPTGALQTGTIDAPPIFDRLLCTGCNLCAEFCLDGAIRIST